MNLLKSLVKSAQKPDRGAARTAPFAVSIDGRTVRFDISSRGTRRFFLPRYENGKLHEEGATRYILSALGPDSVFLDVGANLGWFSMAAAGVARTVYAVEAQEKMVQTVRRNADLNGYGNVHPIAAAAGDRPGFVTMPAEGKPGTSVNAAEAGYQVPVIRLDDYFAGDVVPDVIKIDVEGFELNVLRGAAALLAHRPKVAIELHRSMADFGAKPRDIFELLSDAGYKVLAGAHRKTNVVLEDLGAGSLREDFNNTMVFCEPRV
ncbi:MAG: FkbM family methyltransferase [Pseudomonadota bacterium]